MTSTRRRYLTSLDDLETFADITITDEEEAWDRVDQAEELIDAYIGNQQKAFRQITTGQITAVNSKTIADTSSDSNLDQNDNYFSYCVIEIIAGTGAGSIRPLTASSKTNKTITYAGDAISSLDTTSVFKIYQLGKFPRINDITSLSNDTTVYKTIPENIRRAVCAQVAFMIEMGDAYFAGDDAEMDSENIMSYGYSKGSNGGQAAVVKYVAPRARTLLRGYKRSIGTLVRENPTWL